MRTNVKSGATLAAAAAALLLAGVATAPTAAVAADKGQCYGANACKGQSDCKTANSSCKGQNACKGQGFLEMTKAECDAIAGATFKPAS